MTMSHRLKILHIVSSWESGIGGELAEFIRRIPRDDFDVEICVLAHSNVQQSPDVPTSTRGLRWQFDVSTYLGIGRLLRRFRPDIVHTWDAAAHAYGTLHAGSQRVLAERRDTEVMSGTWQKYLDKTTHRFIVPRKTGNSPKTIVISPAAVPMPCADPISAEELLTKLDFPLLEPSGDYYPVFRPQYEPAHRNYKPVPPHPTPFLIGVVLPLCAEHRILDALWVFETLKHVHLNFHAFVIGDGKDREQCLRYRDRWKLFSRVHFLGNRHATHRLLPHFNVLLHLSPSAEHSGTILSAMSCGVPVIALETPESREYILDGATGILIPAEGDFRFYRRAAAKRLLYLLENEELYRSIQRAAKDRIAEDFNFDTAVQRRIDVYHHKEREA
jgi:glycosyltransferase involved in cell wall biosynthesis